MEQEKQEENKLNGKETHVLIESLKKCNDANIYLEDNENDMLISLFKKQIELQKKFYDKELPNDEPEIMGQHILALVAELGEVMQEDKRWKSWCKNPPKVDFYKKRKEIIDCFHFMINICIYSGMQAEDVYELFVEKNKVNVERQENNY